MEIILPREENTNYGFDVNTLSSKQKDILLIIEDPKFYDHKGIDFSTPGAGMTTITQGLVKDLYFERFTPGLAKIKQSLIARFALDALMPKNMQLRRFINTIYLGENVRGFEEAAQFYYKKEFEKLTEYEYISIVAMIISPATFSIKNFPERNEERTHRIQKVVSGEYRPKGLFDLYYGKLDEEAQKNLPMMSYFSSYYK